MSRSQACAAAVLAFMLLSGCSTVSSTEKSDAPASASPSASPESTVIDKVKDVACGYGFSLIVAEDGRLLACGEYEKNNLGQEDYIPNTEKLRVLDTDVRSCAAGPGICGEIKTDGGLYIWGKNEAFFPQPQTTPVKILDGVQSVALGDTFLLALKSDGSLWAMGKTPMGSSGWAARRTPPNPSRLCAV